MRSRIQTQSGISSPQPRSIACGRWTCPSTRPGMTTQPLRSRTSLVRVRARARRRDLPTAAIELPWTDDRRIPQDPTLGVQRHDRAVVEQH